MRSEKRFGWKSCKWVLLAFMLLWTTSAIFAQEDSAKREEIQRFLGYEDLILRYLSLPYDMTMATNVDRPSFDIGFLILLFLPLLLFSGKASHWKRNILMAAALILYLLLIVPSTFLEKNQLDLEAGIGQLTTLLEQGDGETSWAALINARIKLLLLKTYGLLEPWVAQISGDRDHLTYPVLAALFLMIAWFVLRSRAGREKGRAPHKELLSFTLIYVFFWMLLSSGIIWYGMLGLPLLLLLVLYYWPKQTWVALPSAKWQHYLLGGLGFVSILVSLSFRTTQYIADSRGAQKVFLAPLTAYRIGALDREETFRAVFREYAEVLPLINRDLSTKVYRVGSYLPFFIEQNDRRVMSDNQLSRFRQIRERYQDKEKICEALRANGFRFIVFDLYTYRLDQTPEQSLVQKYREFFQFLTNNPCLELLVTNRIVENAAGERYPALAPPSDGDVLQHGSIAIFQIQ